MHATLTTARIAAAALSVCAAMLPAHAAPVIANGGFESGFTSWTRQDQAGGFGTFYLQSGTTTTDNGYAVPAPPQGSTAAMSDSIGPGSHVLYQDFVASAGPASLSFSLFVGNRGDRFASPSTLDFSIAAINQQVRVDIVRVGADPFSVLAADVLQSIYASAVGDTLITGYNTITADVTALMSAFNGQTLRLRFAEVDNLNTLNMGVDSVAFVPNGTVAEPASLLLASAALASLAALQRGRAGARRRV